MGERGFGEDAVVVEQVPGGEVIACVEDDIVVGDEIVDVRWGEACFVCLNVDVWVECGDVVGCTVDFRAADVGICVDNLALEIRAFDGVVVDDTEAADSGCGQVLDCRRAEAACADDEDAALEEALLSVGADFVHDDVSRVALELGCVEAKVAHGRVLG